MSELAAPWDPRVVDRNYSGIWTAGQNRHQGLHTDLSAGDLGTPWAWINESSLGWGQTGALLPMNGERIVGQHLQLCSPIFWEVIAETQPKCWFREKKNVRGKQPFQCEQSSGSTSGKDGPISSLLSATILRRNEAVNRDNMERALVEPIGAAHPALSSLEVGSWKQSQTISF